MIEALLSLGGATSAVNPKYQEFLDWIDVKGYTNQLATDFSSGSDARSRTQITGTPIGGMWGSSWGRSFTTDSRIWFLIQHGVPSSDVFLDHVANERWVIFRNSLYFTDSNFRSLARNGFTSGANTNTHAAFTMQEIIFWDETLKRVRTGTPYNQGAYKDFVYD